jgi:hypothetical protein
VISDLQPTGSTGNMPLSFVIPKSDEAALCRTVPYEAQKELRLLLHAMEVIHKSDKVMVACRRLAATFAARAELRGARGFRAETLRQKYYAFVRSQGDWRVLLNKAKAPQVTTGLPAAFLEFWRGLCEDNQRVCSEALRELHHIFRTHHSLDGKRFIKAIPGYDHWPVADPRTGVPAGWTEKNLYRHTPDRFELAASRIGRKAASEFRLKLRTTRVGLRLGEFFEFDDHEYNVIVNFPGQWKAMRPRGFAAVDVLSGCCFSHAIKPTLWDEAEEKKRVLTERDFMWFVVSVLTTTGYRTDERGTTLIVEHGTAAIRDAFERRIVDATGGKVRIERSGRYGRPAHGGQMRGEGGGNFRFKPHVEGFFRLLDDRLASLPGQVGKGRDFSPEQLPGIQGYNRALLKDAANMTPERAALLQWPVLLWQDFAGQVDRVMDDIGNDTTHKLEGWEKLKFIVQERREGLDLPVARRLSRREVFNGLRGELVRLDDFHLPALLGPENALRSGEPLTVREGEFEFEDFEMGSEPFRFQAVNEAGRLREGEKFTCFVNPFNPSVLVACDARLRVVALCPPVAMPCRNDREAIQKLQGAVGHWEAAALAPVRARHADQAQALEHMKRHNEAVREGRPVTAHEKAKVRALRRMDATTEDFLEAAAQPATNPNGNEAVPGIEDLL